MIFLGHRMRKDDLARGAGPLLPHIKAGKLRALASFGATRSPALPDVPTLKELGYNVEYYLWVGIFAPKGGFVNT